MDIDEEHIFNEALTRRDPQERVDYLLQACRGSENSKRRIESWLTTNCTNAQLDSTPREIETSLAPAIGGVLEGTHIGPYRILELLGEGGMGEVYLAARDGEVAPQHVALKVIKAGMDSHQILARFELEQKALRRPDHPHIAKFLDSGVTSEGRAYFVRELIRGVALTNFCNRERLTPDRRLALLIQTCTAVQHAHERGIVHRDLKPSNVLVTLHGGIPIVKVIDFGVAKALEDTVADSGPHTRVTQLLGTLRYMSPEQARWSSDVDSRSDVYSLGVLLYELLTGTTPVRKDYDEYVELLDMRRHIHDEDPDWPSRRIAELKDAECKQVSGDRGMRRHQLIQHVRGDLDWITLKALARDREERYGTPAMFAAELKAFLDHRPIAAGPPSLHVRCHQWTRRHRGGLRLSIAAAITGCVVVVLAVSIRSLLDIAHQRNAVGEIYVRSDSDQERKQFVHDMQISHAFIDSGDNLTALNVLAAYEKKPVDERSMRQDFASSFAVPYLRSRIPVPIAEIAGHSHPILDMDLSPNESSLASSDRGGDVIIWDAVSQKEIVRLHTGDAEVTRVRFSPNGKLLATAGQNRLVQLWNTDDWSLTGSLTGHQRTINGLAWSPDGSGLASGDRDGAVLIWDVDTYSCKVVLPKHSGLVRCLAWSPDGNRLATADGDTAVRIWDCASWELAAVIPTNGKGTLAATFSRDSRYLAFGGYHNELVFVSLAKNAVLQRRETDAAITSLTFAANGELIAGLGFGYLQVFQHSPGRRMWTPIRIAAMGSQDSMVRACRFSKNQERLYVAFEKERLIKIVAGPAVLGYHFTPLPFEPIGLIPELNVLLCADYDGRSNVLLNIDTGKVTTPSPVLLNTVCPPEYSHAGGLVATSTADAAGHHVMVHQAGTWELQSSFAVSRRVRKLSFSSDGTILAVAVEQGGVIIRNMITHEVRELPDVAGDAWTSVEFTPGTNHLIFAPAEKLAVHCLRAGTYEIMNSIATNYQVKALCVHPEGEFIVIGELDRISVWTSDLSKSLWTSARMTAKEFSRIVAIDLSPDRVTIAALNDRGIVRFWDVRTQSELFSSQLPIAKDGWIAFTDPFTLQVGSPGQASYVLRWNGRMRRTGSADRHY